jgi:hypothetical protein
LLFFCGARPPNSGEYFGLTPISGYFSKRRFATALGGPHMLTWLLRPGIFALCFLIFSCISGCDCGESGEKTVEELVFAVSGTVTDAQEAPLQDAVVKAFLFDDKKIDEFTITLVQDGEEVKLVDLAKILQAEPDYQTTTDAEGRYRLEEVSVAGVFLLVEKSPAYAAELRGFDDAAGQFSVDKLIKPAEVTAIEETTEMNFTLAGGAMKDLRSDGSATSVSEVDYDAAYECLSSVDCGGSNQGPLCRQGRCAAECDETRPCDESDGKLRLCTNGTCMFRCVSDADCSTQGKICDLDTMGCVAAECVADADCPEGICDNGRCRIGCDASAACEAPLVCVNNFCKQECLSNDDCLAVEKPLCVDNICAAALCTVETQDEDCLGAENPGGLCLGYVCKIDCSADADCGDPGLCRDNRCINDPGEILLPDQNGGWESFILYDSTGEDEVADARSENAAISIVPAGLNLVRITGSRLEKELSKAYLRVQYGTSDIACSNVVPAVAATIPLRIENGKIVGDEGEFFLFYLPGGFVKLQLDADEEPLSGNESFVIALGLECDIPQTPLLVTLSWEAQSADFDLHLWDQNNEHTWQGASFNGEPMRTGYGFVQSATRRGYGPEIISIQAGVSGDFAVRAHYFSGSAGDVPITVRVTRIYENRLWDQVFVTTVTAPGEWIDIGTLQVDGALSIAP